MCVGVYLSVSSCVSFRWACSDRAARRNVTVSTPMVAKRPGESVAVCQGGGVRVNIDQVLKKMLMKLSSIAHGYHGYCLYHVG